MNRRHFLLAGAAAGFSGVPASAAGGMEKSILISMLPGEMPYLDRFKLAVDVGFHLMDSISIDSSLGPSSVWIVVCTMS